MAYLDGRHHHTESEDRHILGADAHDDDGRDIDDHIRHDTVGPDLHDDDDHILDIQEHHREQPVDDTRSQNSPHPANHWVVVGDGDDGDAVLVVVVDIPILVAGRCCRYHIQNDVLLRDHHHSVVRYRMYVVATEHRDDWLRTSLPQLRPLPQQKMGFHHFHSAQNLLSVHCCCWVVVVASSVRPTRVIDYVHHDD